MSFSQGTQYTFDVYANETDSAVPTNASAGSGGGDMYAWLYSRTKKLNTLVTTDYSIGTSNHQLPTAVANSQITPFDVGGVPDGEETMTALSSGGRSGQGGGDMTAWGFTRSNKIDALVTSSYSMGTTNHQLPTAVANSQITPFDVGGVPSGEEYHSKPSKGVTYGPNYFGLLMKGIVRASPNADPTEPNPVVLGDATVVGFHTNSQGTKYSFSTAQKPDGTYGLSISDYGTWTVSSSREYLGKQTKEVNIQSKTTSGVDFLLNLGASGRHARGIGIGTGTIGVD